MAKEISPRVWDTPKPIPSMTNPKTSNAFRYDSLKCQYVFNLNRGRLGIGTWQLWALPGDVMTQTMITKITK